MIVASRVILGIGVGLEGGTVPIYVAETVERRLRGNLVSLYQFNIALGEVLGYAVAAIFLRVPGNWRIILGSSLLFSTIMLIGYVLFLPKKTIHWTYRAMMTNTIPQHALPTRKPTVPYPQGPHA